MIEQLKAHQVAMYVENVFSAVDSMVSLGFDEWMWDEALLVGEVYGRPMETKATMAFNYQFGPNELEFLRYWGPSWHTDAGRTSEAGTPTHPFLSHLSIKCEDLDDAAHDMNLDRFEVVQWFKTHDHKNPLLIERKQSFNERVYGTRDRFGYDIKLITRVVG